MQRVAKSAFGAWRFLRACDSVASGSTTALVVSKLEEAGYIERRDGEIDKRRKIITLSDAGRAMLDRVSQPAQRARERALAACGDKDAAKFLALLGGFVDAFNEQTRAPIRAETGEKPSKGSGKTKRG